MKATFVKNMDGGFSDAKLFSVEPHAVYDDYKTASHVVVSKVNSAWAHETYIFPSDERGNVVSWGELYGSARGEHSHESVLRDAGYKVAKVPA